MPHENEPILCFREGERILPTRQFHILRNEAERLGPAHEEALGVQITRQLRWMAFN